MKLLIADDHQMVRRGLVMLLGKLFDSPQILDVGNLQDALDSVDPADPPDIILLDLLMPGMNGMEGLNRMGAKLPQVPIAILSAHEEPDMIMASIEKGAKGFILKSSNEEVLKLAISLILSGETYIPSRLLREGATPVQAASERATGLVATPQPPFDKLTRREEQALRLLMEGLSNRDIAGKLGVVEGTVKKYLQDIFQKLEVSNRTHAVLKCINLGWPGTAGKGSSSARSEFDGSAE